MTSTSLSVAQLTDFLSQAAQFSSPSEKIRNEFLSIHSNKEAAVLLAIVFKHGEWHIILTRRSSSLSHHTGEISLAGGKRDAQDPSIIQTALREAEEEIGTPTTIWQTFPSFPAHYTPSGYTVFSIPALYPDNPTLLFNPDEVAEIIYLPLNFALNIQHYSNRILHYQQKSLSTPTLFYQNHEIWGLTAMIIYSLAERYQQYRATLSK